MAKVIEDQPAGDSHGPKKGHRSGGGQAQTETLLHAADEARNRTAGEALELYYKLATAEAGVRMYRATEQELDLLLKDARQAAGAGLKEPADLLELESQRAEVHAEVIRAEGGIKELNYGLAALLGLPHDPNRRFWPDQPVVKDVPADADEAVRTGLQSRPDLLLLRSLLSSQDPAAPQIARQALGGVNPLLGGGSPLSTENVGVLMRLVIACSGLGTMSPASEAQTMRQLKDLLTEREKQAEAEIRAAVDRAAALAARARTYSELADRLWDRIEELEKREAAGRGNAAAVAKAKAAWRKAYGNTLTASTEYQTAVAKLRQAQGGLVREVLDAASRPVPPPR